MAKSRRHTPNLAGASRGSKSGRCGLRVIHTSESADARN
jgi:hypothetical protein